MINNTQYLYIPLNYICFSYTEIINIDVVVRLSIIDIYKKMRSSISSVRESHTCLWAWKHRPVLKPTGPERYTRMHFLITI